MKSRPECKSSGWSVAVFENEHSDDKVAYVVGPFKDYHAAVDWAENNEEGYEITINETPVQS